VFQRFFEAIVDQCQQAGLVWGKELFVDATKVHANASLDSVKPRFAVDAHLRELFSPGEEGEPEQHPHVEPSLPTREAAPSPPETIREEATPPGEAPVPPTAVGESTGAAPVPLPVCLEDALREDLTRANEQRHDWIEQQGRPQREVIRGSYRRMADFVVSTTDPDATIMPDLWGGTPFGLPYSLRGGWGQVAYHPGRVGHPPGSNGKPTHARVRVFRARFRWKLWPRQITGDTTYGTLDNIVAVEDQHMRAYVPLPDFDKRTSVYGKQAFRYDPERDVYI
jgi:hypothetical protein